jgi:protoporphyrinogen/coproporphyrinogen III oxidase
MKRVVVVGGGIAGLATAFYLLRRARESGMPVHCTLLEKDRRLGGKIVTTRERGFIIEGGPDSFISQKPEGAQLCRDAGLGGDLLPSNDAVYRTRLLRNGRLIPFPDGFRLAVPTKLWPFVKSPLLSPLGKLRMGLDLVLPPRRETSDESLADFITRRLGREALERIAGPIMSAIYVADPERMSVQSTFPMFVELERKYGSLTRGIIRARRAAAAARPGRAPPAVFTSLRDGMGSLVEALARALDGAEVRTGVEVGTVERTGEGGYRLALTDGVTLEADALVLATPAMETARLVAPWQPALAADLSAIRYVSSATINLAYRDADLAGVTGGGGFGFVVPRDEPAGILAFTWSCRKFDGRAPEGCQLVRAFVGGARHEESSRLPEAALISLVRDELRRVMGITADPVGAWVYPWPEGNAQFDVGHLDRIDRIERTAAATPGLHLVGGAYRGVGIPDCARGAKKAAETIAFNG